MRGNLDETFLGKINETVMSLLTGAVRNCLNECQIGNRLETYLIEFKYETAASK